jgi:hypothetical protein
MKAKSSQTVKAFVCDKSLAMHSNACQLVLCIYSLLFVAPSSVLARAAAAGSTSDSLDHLVTQRFFKSSHNAS